jgi:hypothetical protein
MSTEKLSDQAGQNNEPEISKEYQIAERKVFGGDPKLEVSESKNVVASFASFQLEEAQKFRELWSKAQTATEKLQAMIACVEVNGTLGHFVRFWWDEVPNFDPIEGIVIAGIKTEDTGTVLRILKGDKTIEIPLRSYSAGRDKDD